MNENNNQVTLFNDGQANGFASKTMKSGSFKIGVETRSVWAKANGLKPSSAEARKRYAAHMKAQSTILSAELAGAVAEGGFLPMAVTRSKNGNRLTATYVKPESLKKVVSAKNAELLDENAKLRKMLADAGMDADSILAGLKARNEAAHISKVA